MAAPASIVLPAPDLALPATLACGQTFTWHPQPDQSWSGWINQQPVQVRGEQGKLLVWGQVTSDLVRDYFQLDFPLAETLAQLPQDSHLQAALNFSPGLRILRQDPWETTANFICSSLKQIVQIQQINTALRATFGTEIQSGRFTFPSFTLLAQHSENDLRACKLGYRARHLHRAAQQLTEGVVNLDLLQSQTTEQARAELMKLQGVGEKVANCILLFAYGRLEAFPIDVWVERILRELYFPKKRRVTRQRLRKFAADYFGPYGGYAQQYLFHWMRHRPKA